MDLKYPVTELECNEAVTEGLQISGCCTYTESNLSNLQEREPFLTRASFFYQESWVNIILVHYSSPNYKELTHTQTHAQKHTNSFTIINN